MARLPPFISLRALEAAARHKSYSRAASELHVTHGAVSHQIRRLEEELGCVLFKREGNVMEPTAAALKLSAKVSQAMKLMQTAVDSVAIEASAGPLVISAEPGFARLWLAPRFARLREETGEAEIEIRLEERKADLAREGVDAAIRHGRGEWPDLEAIVLFQERLFPVCSPEFAAAHKIKRPADLFNAPLLRHTVWQWRPWFLSLGIDPPAELGGMMFDDTAFMLDAAARGLGVALARSSLAGPDLASGRLVQPLSEEIPGDWGYYFVWSADCARQKRVFRLRDWLVAEAAHAEMGN